MASTKNQPMLVWNNFVYSKHSKKKKGDTQYWRCTERDKCNARCSTPVDDHTKILRDGSSKHTHIPEKAEIEAKKAMQRIKRRAEQQPNEPPDRILAMELQDEHDEEVLANLPETENLGRYVNRTQNRLRPRNPQNLAEVEIVDPYKTRAGDKFLFYDWDWWRGPSDYFHY